MLRVPVHPDILRWACERGGRNPADFADRFPKIHAWIAGELVPTLKQLEALAKATHTPFGFLFLDKPPVERLPVPDFRTVKAVADRPSPELLDTLYTMQRRQAWLRDTLVESASDPVGFVNSASLTDDPEGVGQEMRRIIGEDVFEAVSRWTDAVSALRRGIERHGVVAVINGIVGNNTHRTLDVAEFRGFALTDEYAPLIFVNGADAKSAQMFTLAHELAHLWLGAEGISGFEGLFPVGADVEDWCNRAAAEMLVPAREVKRLWPEARSKEAPFKFLSTRFKVSPIVAGRRVLDLHLVV